jgi:general secretion pathway protein D
MIRLSHATGAVLVLLALTQAGCQGVTKYQGAQSLLAEGKVEEGLAQLHEAMKAQPNNPEYRSAYVATRERAVYLWLEQAERARQAGRAAEAEALYKRILAIDPGNARALSAREQASRDVRHDNFYREAQAAWKNNDAQTASDRLRAILSENAGHRGALELKRAIEEKTVRPPEQPKLSDALRKPITIEFRDAPIRQVFEVFARTAGLNFVFDREVRSDLRTTVFLRNTTIQEAVSLVLLTNQLEQRVLNDSSILIYPNTPAKAREYQALTVRTFFLNNGDVKSAAATLRTIIKTRDIVIDEKQNMLVIRDTPEAIRLAERLLALHDLPEPEVMLEVEILEVKRTRLMDLGIQWPSQLSLSPLSTTGGTSLTLSDLKNISSSSLGATIDPAIINLRKEDTDANILANPRIRSRNREKARILVGDRLPNITTTATATGFVAESVTYVDVGLKLEVEPTIHMDDEVAIKIALEVSNVVNQIQTRSGSLAFQIGTRNATSVLRLRNGENQVLAGLISDEDRYAANKVPGLGDLPIIGRLFGRSRDDVQKTEIVLSITPRIVRNPQRPALRDAEFDVGTEASLRTWSGDARAAEPLPNGKPRAAPPPAIPSGSQPAPGAQPPASPSAPGAQPSATPAAPGAAGMGEASSAPAESMPMATAPSPAVGGSAVGGPTAIVPPATSFAWQGPGQASTGATFIVALAISPDQPINSVPFSIGFDPRQLEIIAVNEGDFMRQGGGATSFASRIDAAAGRVFGTVTRNTPDGAGFRGTLVILSVRALAPAQNATLQLVAASPVGLGGRSVTTQNGTPFSIIIAP